MGQTLPVADVGEHARCGRCGKNVPVVAGRLAHHLTAGITAQRCPGTGDRSGDARHFGSGR